MEMIGSIQEILCLLLTVQKMAEGEIKGFYVGFSHSPCRKRIHSTACCTLLPCHPYHAHSSSNALFVKNAKKCLGDNAFRLVQGDLSQLQGPNTLDPAFSFQKMPIHSNHLHFAVHHNQPISVSFLNRRQSHKKLNKKTEMIREKEELYNLEYHCIRPSKSFRQTCTSQIFLLFVSQLLYK